MFTIFLSNFLVECSDRVIYIQLQIVIGMPGVRCNKHGKMHKMWGTEDILQHATCFVRKYKCLIYEYFELCIQ